VENRATSLRKKNQPKKSPLATSEYSGDSGLEGPYRDTFLEKMRRKNLGDGGGKRGNLFSDKHLKKAGKT